jgi:hypothetical protein
MLAKLKATKFNSIQELVNGLFASELIFMVDSATKEDIYILNEKKLKNKSEHYRVMKNKDNQYQIKEVED